MNNQNIFIAEIVCLRRTIGQTSKQCFRIRKYELQCVRICISLIQWFETGVPNLWIGPCEPHAAPNLNAPSVLKNLDFTILRYRLVRDSNDY